jgi:hypothetical protein
MLLRGGLAEAALVTPAACAVLRDAKPLSHAAHAELWAPPLTTGTQVLGVRRLQLEQGLQRRGLTPTVESAPEMPGGFEDRY